MKNFAKFLIVGVFNTALGYAIIFACMYLLGLSSVFSNAIGYLAGLTISYTLNRKFTFKSTSKAKSEMVRFLVVFLIAYFSNLGILVLLIGNLGVHEGVAQILAGMVYVAMSYALNRYYVFRQNSNVH